MQVDENNKSAAMEAWSIRQTLNRTLAYAEYCVLYALGMICGAHSIVRYLKNPNPIITVRLLRVFGASIGNDTTVKGGIVLDNVFRDKNSTKDFSHLKIGRNCYIGESVFFDLANEIVIEDNAVIAGRASFITHSECNRSEFLSKQYARKCKPILVGCGAWIGFGATVLLGVTIGRNAAIGAHSVVLEDAEAQCLYVGTPARKLRRIE